MSRSSEEIIGEIIDIMDSSSDDEGSISLSSEEESSVDYNDFDAAYEDSGSDSGSGSESLGDGMSDGSL